MSASNGSEFYQRVSDTSTIDRRLLIDQIFPGFNCRGEGNQVVEIQRGDVVGACIFDPEDGFIARHSQLDVVGEGSNHSLLETDDISGCDIGMVPSQILVSNLREQRSRILHLYAEIGTIFSMTLY
jgi:hypothetical protein